MITLQLTSSETGDVLLTVTCNDSIDNLSITYDIDIIIFCLFYYITFSIVLVLLCFRQTIPIITTINIIITKGTVTTTIKTNHNKEHFV